MKTRVGFVSNSSTTSFMIYGARFDDEMLRKKFGLDEDDDLWDAMDSMAEKAGLCVYFCPHDGDGAFVGCSLDECRDDQTMGDFKKEVKNKMSPIFGDVEYLVHLEGWED
jgi:hypothetical protein